MTSTPDHPARRNDSHRTVSDAIGLHNVCPMAACRRHRRCMLARPGKRMLGRLGPEMASRVRGGLPPCMALFAEGFHAGIPGVVGIVDAMKAREAELRAREIEQGTGRGPAGPGTGAGLC